MCKTETYLDKKDLKKKKSPYCRKCYKKSQQYLDDILESLNNRPVIQKLCECGKQFDTKNVRKKFCSPKCRYIFTYKKPPKKEKLCECGNMFYPTDESRKFCSLECPKRITTFCCLNCQKSITETTKEFEKRKYLYCVDCYLKSPEKIEDAKAAVKNRASYNGENNPNYRGQEDFVCPCGDIFTRRVSPSQKGTRFHTYCSTKCKKKYSISKAKYFDYKGYKFRSSWELTFAEYLDSKNYTWKYEPESFETPYGFYTPDFWVEELRSYVEVKGYFRDQQARDKFEYFSKTHKVILVDESYFKSIGFQRIKSGPKKGQLCLQSHLP